MRTGDIWLHEEAEEEERREEEEEGGGGGIPIDKSSSPSRGLML